MLKNIKNLLKRTLVSNLAMGLIALPLGTVNLMPQAQDSPLQNAQASLIIPQEKLDIAFNISTPKPDDSPKIQIPIVFTYMSQGFSLFHPGIDLATKYGTIIKPFKAGVVEEAGFSPFGYGNAVLIDHGDGIESLYAHLSKIKVKIGDTVDLDTEIGLVGMTGHSTGPHLHLEVHKNGKAINPLTMLPVLKSSGDLLTLNQQ